MDVGALGLSRVGAREPAGSGPGVVAGAVAKWGFGWDVVDWVPGPQPTFLILLVTMFAWGGWYQARVSRLRPAIAASRLCFQCGYSLLHTEVDDAGIGRCPECGTEFDAAQYEPPPEEGP